MKKIKCKECFTFFLPFYFGSKDDISEVIDLCPFCGQDNKFKPVDLYQEEEKENSIVVGL